MAKPNVIRYVGSTEWQISPELLRGRMLCCVRAAHNRLEASCCCFFLGILNTGSQLGCIGASVLSEMMRLRLLMLIEARGRGREG